VKIAALIASGQRSYIGVPNSVYTSMHWGRLGIDSLKKDEYRSSNQRTTDFPASVLAQRFS
jgi:hypothetical protein